MSGTVVLLCCLLGGIIALLAFAFAVQPSEESRRAVFTDHCKRAQFAPAQCAFLYQMDRRRADDDDTDAVISALPH